MAKKNVAPVYPAPPAQEKESRWQCATCQGYLAFSLPIDTTVMAQMLKTFSKAHERCAPAPLATPPAAPVDKAGPAPAPSPVAEPGTGPGMAFDPKGPTAKAWNRREALLALPRAHTPTERRELERLVKKLTEAGVLTLSTTF